MSRIKWNFLNRKFLMLVVAGLSTFMCPTGTVIIFIPVTLILQPKQVFDTSRPLMPINMIKGAICDNYIEKDEIDLVAFDYNFAEISKKIQNVFPKKMPVTNSLHSPIFIQIVSEKNQRLYKTRK